MEQLLAALGQWALFFLSLVNRDAGNPANITSPRLDIVHGIFSPSAAIAQNTKALFILFVVAPVVIFAVVGIYKRFLSRS